MTTLQIAALDLELLPEKAVYVESLRSLLVADVHLGKSETFQHFGIPVPSQVNQTTLARLQALCHRFQPEFLWILGDLFHGQAGMVAEVLAIWRQFLEDLPVKAHLIVGNHDRPLVSSLRQLPLDCRTEAVELGAILLSHEPHPDRTQLNLCGHVHPCLRLNSRLDRLRLPCFHWEPQQNRITLPAFGEFTGGYDVRLVGDAVAYAIAEEQIVPFRQSSLGRRR